MRFVVDGMLGGLSRWLRILGYDVKYCNDAPDNEVLEIAEAEGRVLLTRDMELFRRAGSRGVDAFYVEGEREEERLARVAQRYSVRLDVDMSISRCPVCGASLNRVDGEAVLGRVPSGTLKHYEEFWVCGGCGKVYWRGRHWKKINETLDKAKELAEEIIY